MKRRQLPVELHGRSPQAHRLRQEFTDATRPASRVTIVAPPGMDGVAVAAAVHRQGRSGGPLVVIDCANADAAALERRLFGRRGRSRRNGPLEWTDPDSALVRSRRGTLVLDSIHDLAGPLQARLARALRDGEVRVTGQRVAVPLECRVVGVGGSAFDDGTDRSQLRTDLRRRLEAVTMVLVPLAERREDTPDVVRALVADVVRERGVTPRAFTQSALALVAVLPWPDNMKGVRALIVSLLEQGSGPVLVEDVLAYVGTPGASVIGPYASLREARRQFERQYIAAVLRRCNGRVALAARALGIQRTNLYRKARQLGLQNGGHAT